MENKNIDRALPKKKRIGLKIFLGIVALFLIVGGAFAWKTGFILNKVSTKGGIFSSLIHSLPGASTTLQGEADGRINMLLLGMRGENVSGGGLLADTIMVISIKPADNKVSIISIPRDLYVEVPERGFQSKINAVHLYGEEKSKGEGLEAMKKVVSEIAGMPIHYAVSTNFRGFTDLVNAIGGITVKLDEPFEEPLQFREEHVCDPNVFTEPTGNFQLKKNEKGKIVAQYPLCLNKNLECGGDFKLPAGENQLNGERALCYARARYTSNDFERARRQQKVIQAIKEKATSAGTLTDITKLNAILNSLGDNVRTDLEPWEMKSFLGLYQKMQNPELIQKVLEDSEEGLLYAPEMTQETGYILLPRGDNYSRIQELFRNIFSAPTQTTTKKK